MNVAVTMDNDERYGTCCRNFNFVRLTHVGLIRFNTQSASSLTASFRFDSELNVATRFGYPLYSLSQDDTFATHNQ